MPIANLNHKLGCLKHSSETIYPDGTVYKGDLWKEELKYCAIRDGCMASNKKIIVAEKIKSQEKEKQKKEFLNAKFGEVCQRGFFKKGYEKGSKEYEDCLLKNEKEYIAEQKKIKIKLSKMSPLQRKEYNCENAFKFRKHSDDFKQCVFKLYTAELELEKLELQKQVALANQRAAEAEANAAASDKARADAVARAQIEAANAQSAAAQSTNLINSLSMMKMGLNLLIPQRPVPQQQPRFRTTCSNVGGFLSCF